MDACNDNATPAGSLVPIVGHVGGDDSRVTFTDPAYRARLAAWRADLARMDSELEHQEA